ncbi:MAG: hypothetical protein LUD81_10080 [Clostridiales bacterium]|nr:hypothetical protein [Clostridiales bacterium]
MARTKKTAAEAVTETAETTTLETVETVETNKTAKSRERTFLKSSIVRFAKYARVRDLLSALLEDGRKYSIREVDEILKGAE